MELFIKKIRSDVIFWLLTRSLQLCHKRRDMYSGKYIDFVIKQNGKLGWHTGWTI